MKQNQTVLGCPTAAPPASQPWLPQDLQLEAECSDLSSLHVDQYLQVHLQTQQCLSTAALLKKKIILPLI